MIDIIPHDANLCPSRALQSGKMKDWREVRSSEKKKRLYHDAEHKKLCWCIHVVTGSKRDIANFLQMRNAEPDRLKGFH